MAIPKVCLTREPDFNSSMEYICRGDIQVQFDDATDLIASCHPFFPAPFAHPALCHMLLFTMFWYSAGQSTESVESAKPVKK